MRVRQPFKAVESRLAGLGPLLTTRVASERMSRVRQHGTAPEILVRRVVSSFGNRYTIHNRDLPGSPDIANRSKRWVIFVHGCYWHHHASCRRATVPKSNADFWLAKFAANRHRDAEAAKALRKQGYAVYTLWECACKSPEAIAGSLKPLCSSKDGE
jgi:DNA mismatch endonuclease (patch repair protein)